MKQFSESTKANVGTFSIDGKDYAVRPTITCKEGKVNNTCEISETPTAHAIAKFSLEKEGKIIFEPGEINHHGLDLNTGEGKILKNIGIVGKVVLVDRGQKHDGKKAPSISCKPQDKFVVCDVADLPSDKPFLQIVLGYGQVTARSKKLEVQEPFNVGDVTKVTLGW